MRTQNSGREILTNKDLLMYDWHGDKDWSMKMLGYGWIDDEADELNKIIPNKANARQAAFAGVGEEKAEIAMNAGRITSLIADFTPIGGIKGVVELLLKKDLVTHEEFNLEELASMKIGAVKSILNIGTSKLTS